MTVDERAAARPRGPLRGVVREHHGYRQRGLRPGAHLGMPSPYLTVIFTLGEPLQVRRHPDPAQPAGRFDALVGGLHDSPALIVHDGAQAGVQLQLSPLAARPLFGMPAGELAALDLDAGDVLGPLAERLLDRLADADDWSSCFRALDEGLGAALDPERMPPRELVSAWTLLLRSGGRMRVRELAERVGWSERHLGAVMLRELGLTPKTAARVIRFDTARRALQDACLTGEPNIGAVAAASGYFDQSHLVRDWRRFTGMPPSEWIAHEVRNFQAAEARAVPA
jgi:AraC-like DNA-binding protein